MNNEYVVCKKLSEIDTLRFNSIAKVKHKCPTCGHTILISNARDTRICNVCGSTVYRDKKLEFINKLKSLGIGV